MKSIYEIESSAKKEVLEEILEKLNPYKIPCECPKGGVYEENDNSVSICQKCGGTEYRLSDQLQIAEWIIKKEIDKY